MRLILICVVLCGVAGGQEFSSTTPPAPIQPSPSQPTVTTPNGAPEALPPLPKGKSTVIGGAVRSVDQVRDQMTLTVFGGKSIKVLFDERTRVFRDGKQASLEDLKAGDRVSLETMLDGPTVFVRTIHRMSGAPEGQFRGQVLRYDSVSGELMVRDSLSSQAIKLRVSRETNIVHQGQESSSAADLRPGALITASFVPDNRGQGAAREISILATPGSVFEFSGTVAFLDMHAGALVIFDPRDQQRYEVSFDAASITDTREIHEGSDVAVKAYFDGRRYSAQTIMVDPHGAK